VTTKESKNLKLKSMKTSEKKSTSIDRIKRIRVYKNLSNFIKLYNEKDIVKKNFTITKNTLCNEFVIRTCYNTNLFTQLFLKDIEKILKDYLHFSYYHIECNEGILNLIITL
jgi:hypothetical protein